MPPIPKPEELKELITNLSQKVGIDLIGFTSSADFYDLKESLLEQQRLGHTSGFEHKNIDERLDPGLIFQNPQTIISIALTYPSRAQNHPDQIKVKRGEFALASRGLDYHKILAEKMDLLIAEIKKELQNQEIRFKPMVDTGEMIDVVVAHRAGLGFIGKNGLLISEKFGSYLYLGEIITNLKILTDQSKPNLCGSCQRCVVNCPTQALLGNGQINAQRCLSFQSQKKGYIKLQYRKLMRRMLYGCDICQLTCPYNRSKDYHIHQEMEDDYDIIFPELKRVLSLNNKSFKMRFSKLSGAWRGKNNLIRNAIIAVANTRDYASIPELIRIIEESPVMTLRGISAWSLGELIRKPGKSLINLFIKNAEQEEDLETKNEFLQVLGRWL